MVAGLVAVATIPAAVVASEVLASMELLHAAFAVPAAAVIGLFALALAGRALRQVQLTVGRVGGERTAAAGRLLGLLAVYLALTAALALGFFGLLKLFAAD